VRRSFWFVAGGCILGLVGVVAAAHAVAFTRQEWPYSTATLPVGLEGPSKEHPLVPGSAFALVLTLGIPASLLGGGVLGWLACCKVGRGQLGLWDM
jgi:hypothetical protein